MILSDIVFSARLSGDVSFPLNGQVIFDNVISNVGNGYNSATGNFTVPHSGTYELTLTTMGTHATAANIMRGENGLCQAYSKEGSIIGKLLPDIVAPHLIYSLWLWHKGLEH